MVWLVIIPTLSSFGPNNSDSLPAPVTSNISPREGQSVFPRSYLSPLWSGQFP